MYRTLTASVEYSQGHDKSISLIPILLSGRVSVMEDKTGR